MITDKYVAYSYAMSALTSTGTLTLTVYRLGDNFDETQVIPITGLTSTMTAANLVTAIKASIAESGCNQIAVCSYNTSLILLTGPAVPDGDSVTAVFSGSLASAITSQVSAPLTLPNEKAAQLFDEKAALDATVDELTSLLISERSVTTSLRSEIDNLTGILSEAVASEGNSSPSSTRQGSDPTDVIMAALAGAGLGATFASLNMQRDNTSKSGATRRRGKPTARSA